jgi:NAD(P)H-hydrate repair Nnr-like enzyme with NAD(P)H-hydrate dehydratase domain
MGDVLTGIIAAFIAQGLSADDALLLAVHLHGAAGDALAKQHATIGMTASEVTEWARWLLNQWV